MRCHSQFCHLHSLPGVLPPAAKLPRRCFPNPALCGNPHQGVATTQTCLGGCTQHLFLWAPAVSQPAPGSEQPCSHRAPAFTAHTNVKGLPGPRYLTKLLWAGEATFVQLLHASKIVVPYLDCRTSVNTSRPFYLLLYFPGQTALAEGVEAG